jgi:hypothetical protein
LTVIHGIPQSGHPRFRLNTDTPRISLERYPNLFCWNLQHNKLF